jgi:signal transduction histidine kinase/CheY-like chemotaxis protein
MSRRVLIIDDEDVYRAAVANALRNEQYELFQAESPEEGIDMLDRDSRIAVILLDLSFQNSNGKAVLDHIKPRSSAYRVIILTAHGELLDHAGALDYDVFRYLSKTDPEDEMTSANEALRFSLDQAFKELERAELYRKLAFVQEIQTKITSNADFNETLNLVCHVVHTLVGAYTCHIRVYNFSRGDYDLAGFAGSDDIREIFRAPRAKGDMYSGTVVGDGHPRYEPNLQETDEFKHFAKAARERGVMTKGTDAYWANVRSAYILPISTGVFDPAIDAVLNVSSDQIDYFDEAKQSLVCEFVILAAIVITKHWLQEKRTEAQSDYARISQMLSEMTEALDSGSADRSIYDVVTERISEIVSPEVVSVFLYDETRDVLRNVTELRGDEKVASLDEEYAPGRSLTGSVFLERRTLQIPEPGDPDRSKPLEDKRFDHENRDRYLRDIPSGRLEHYLGVPILIGDRAVGVVRAVNKKSAYYEKASAASNVLCLLERGFSKDCRNAVEIAASHLSVAIRNAELIRERERKVEQIRSLGVIGRRLNSVSDGDEVLNLAIQDMAEVVDAEICMLFLTNIAGDRIELKKCYGIPMLQASYELGEGVTGTVAKTGKPRLIRTVDQEGKYDHDIRRLLSAKHHKPAAIESLMVVPIVARGKVLGAMKVINKTGDDFGFTDWDLDLFLTFADYAGVAILNADRLAIAERNSALSLIVSAVAHEINNTSGVIPASVQKIKEVLGPPAKLIERMLTRIDDAASQATEFANEIAGFSAKRVGTQQPLDIREVIREAIDEIDIDRYHVQTERPRRSARDVIWLDLSLDETPLVCNVFETPFAQIVRNIAINAFQALEGRPDAKLLIEARRGPDVFAERAVIRFRDNGPGIKREHLERIFKPDFTTKPKGNGIGLWLVQKHLDSIHGTIGVESEHGYGATFIVTVPLFRGTSSTV